LIAAAVAALARVALVRRERVAWACIAGALVLWAAGETYWWETVANLNPQPFPTAADAMWLAFYPLSYAGLVALARPRIRRVRPSACLDGVVGALCLAGIGSAVVLPPILAGQGSTLAVATNLAYPIGDMLSLAFLSVVLALTGWRPGRALIVLGAGFAVAAVADSLYLYRIATDTFTPGTALDSIWPAAMLLIAFAAWQRPSPPPSGEERWIVLTVPLFFALAALILLVVGAIWGIPALAVAFAAAAVLVAMIRGLLTVRENLALVESRRRQALVDQLTGLPNRRLLIDRAEQALLASRRAGDRGALMLMDLDRFKEVNDTLGHHAGDRLLRDVGERLSGALRAGDTVARLGGDEFAVLLPEVRDAPAAAAVAEHLLRTLARPIPVEGLLLETEASIGIALFPDHGDDVDQLLRRADIAMYAAKTSHTRLQVFHPRHDRHSPERLELVGTLGAAISGGELEVHYQPKVDLDGLRVIGAEALVRWRHPERGLLAPAEFVPLAEQTALMRPLTLYVLEQALATCAGWRRMGLDLSVSVNVSARHLADARLPYDVAELLERHDVPPDRLELEITEGTLMGDRRRATGLLRRLAERGVALAIDDFGTGYSSLSYLRDLPVHVLKIDKSFVLSMIASDDDRVIVRSTIELAHSLGLRVVAEGIETEEALEALRGLGCDLGQGYHLSRPLPPEAFEAWMAGHRASQWGEPRERAASPSAPA
jgi:diguanylate cyclase (GGDEF)-like protein